MMMGAVKCRGLIPRLVTWILCVGLTVPTFCGGNASPGGVNFTTVPAPLSSTTRGLDEALSLMRIVPELVPLTFGLKIAEIVQFPCGAMVPRQVVRTSNGAPLEETDDMVTGAIPSFVRITGFGALVVPMS